MSFEAMLAKFVHNQKRIKGSNGCPWAHVFANKLLNYNWFSLKPMSLSNTTIIFTSSTQASEGHEDDAHISSKSCAKTISENNKIIEATFRKEKNQAKDTNGTRVNYLAILKSTENSWFAHHNSYYENPSYFRINFYRCCCPAVTTTIIEEAIIITKLIFLNYIKAPKV